MTKTIRINSYLVYYTQCRNNDIPPLTKGEWGSAGCPTYHEYAGEV